MINIEQQYDDIYTEYYRVIHVFAMAKGAAPHIAEEIASETFTRLWEKRNECEFNDPDDRVNENLLRRWLYRVAENVLYEYWRSIHNDSNFEKRLFLLLCSRIEVYPKSRTILNFRGQKNPRI